MPTTIAGLLTGISFADVSTGIIGAASLVLGIYVTWRSAKFIVAAVKSL